MSFLPSFSYFCELYHFHADVLSRFSPVQLFATLWTVARQAPPSMGLSRQEYWSGLPCPPPGDLLDPGFKPAYLSCLLHWQAGSLLLALHGKPLLYPTCTETAGSEGLRRRDCSPGLPGPRLGSTQRLLETHHRQKQGQPRFTRMFYLLLPFFLTRYN